MEKKEVYICQQQYDFTEDEIDLKEIFQTLWNYRKFIFVFVSLITFISIIYAYITKPIYQIESFVEIGYYNTNTNTNTNTNKEYFIEPNSALIMINNEFTQKNKLPNLNSISFKKGTKLLDIKIDAYSNEEAKQYLNKIIDYILKQENTKLTLFIKNNQMKINNLKEYKKILLKQLKEFKEKLEIEKNPIIYQTLLENINNLNDKIFSITSQIEDLKMEISPLNITKTHIIGKILENDYPIKPKKKLIVIVSFITSFILSIFLVFFSEFIKSIRKETN